MGKKASKAKIQIAGLLSAVILVLAVSPAEANKQNNRSFTMAERQLLLLERMTNSALLAALGIDAAPRLGSIHWSRFRFDTMQKELRQGNPGIGLVPTTKPELVQALDRVDALWRRYDALFVEVAKSKKISREQMTALTASHAETLEALAELVRAYQYFAHGGDHHSILSSTITGTGRLRASTQILLRGLMTAAYGDYAPQDREQLSRMMTSFDEMMQGLLHGSVDLRLLPAATTEIRNELVKVDLMWQEMQPILRATVAGNAVNANDIAKVAQYASDMAVPLTRVLIMYLTI